MHVRDARKVLNKCKKKQNQETGYQINRLSDQDKPKFPKLLHAQFSKVPTTLSLVQLACQSPHMQTAVLTQLGHEANP